MDVQPHGPARQGHGAVHAPGKAKRPNPADGRPTRAPRPTARACFRDSLPGEVTSGGRKLVGSAQWRRRGALLQHGSILLENDQHFVDDLRVRPAASRTDPGATSLVEALGRLPTSETIVGELARGFEGELGLLVVFGDVTAPELRLAGRLEARYSDDAWTWRR